VIPDIADTHLLDPHLIPSIEIFSLTITTLALYQRSLRRYLCLFSSELIVKSHGRLQAPDPKNYLLDRYRDIMITATFAETGKSDIAIEFLSIKKIKNKYKRRSA
jgi:hypothetical protein